MHHLGTSNPLVSLAVSEKASLSPCGGVLEATLVLMGSSCRQSPSSALLLCLLLLTQEMLPLLPIFPVHSLFALWAGSLPHARAGDVLCLSSLGRASPWPYILSRAGLGPRPCPYIEEGQPWEPPHCVTRVPQDKLCQISLKESSPNACAALL